MLGTAYPSLSDPFPYSTRCPASAEDNGLSLSCLRGGSGLSSVDNWVPGIAQDERKAPFQDWISLQKHAEAPT